MENGVWVKLSLFFDIGGNRAWGVRAWGYTDSDMPLLMRYVIGGLRRPLCHSRQQSNDKERFAQHVM